jgi:hypothetical protein
MNTQEVSQQIKDSLDRYVNHKIETGSFLRAVLENDLLRAVGKADKENLKNLPEIVSYIYNELPSNCWGSPIWVKKWLGEFEEGEQKHG